MLRFRTFFLAIFVSALLIGFVRSSVAQGAFMQWLEQRRQQQANAPGSEAFSKDPTFTLQHGGLTRKYKVHVPMNYNPNQATPVVIYLHGGGGSMKACYNDGMDKEADKLGFILVNPAGTGPISDFALTWNSGEWDGGACCGQAVTKNVDDVGFISKMIDEVKSKYNVDANRIYATGISNGGMMSYRVGMELSDKIAAIAPVAPPAIPAGITPKRPISVLHVHGTADPCAPFNGGSGGGCIRGSKRFTAQSARQMVDYWIQFDGCPTSSRVVYQKGNSTTVSYGLGKNGTEVAFTTIQGGGHAWPSGNQYYSASKIGPVTYDYSFDQMWDFLQKHPMNS